MLVLVLVLVLGGGELGRLAWLGAFDLAARLHVLVRCKSNAHLRVCRRQLALDAPPDVLYKIGAGSCLGICKKKKPTSFTVRVPVIFKGTFMLRVQLRGQGQGQG